MTELEFHPVADLFPMLADDELAELAEDIKQRGLIQPIVLDAQGRVLDGRNRLAACRLAGVEPAFTTYEGGDPDGYALAVNIARRHLSKGQKAMVVALADLDRNYQDRVGDVSRQYVSWAQSVRDFAPDLAELVAAGDKPLQEAYDVARARRVAAQETRGKLDRLRLSAPDLAAHVDDERMSLDDAIAALDAREERAQQEAETAKREAEARASEEERQRREQAAVERAHAARVSDTFRSIVGRVLFTYKTPELRADVIEHYAGNLGDAMPAEINADTIREAGDYLHMIADEWKKDRS